MQCASIPGGSNLGTLQLLAFSGNLIKIMNAHGKPGKVQTLVKEFYHFKTQNLWGVLGRRELHGFRRHTGKHNSIVMSRLIWRSWINAQDFCAVCKTFLHATNTSWFWPNPDFWFYNIMQEFPDHDKTHETHVLYVTIGDRGHIQFIELRTMTKAGNARPRSVNAPLQKQRRKKS